MAFTPDFLEFVLEQLNLVPGVVGRKMFGAVGLSARGRTFGILDDDVLYLKVDDTNRGDFEAAGMEAFAPYAEKPEYKMGYYEVPIDVLEDRDTLAVWARKAIAVAEAAAAKKPSASKKKLAAPVKKTAAAKKKTAAKKPK